MRFAYLLPDGRTFDKVVTVGAHARFNVWVDYESFDGGVTYPLADTSHSTVVESLDDVGIIAERAMWWQSLGSEDRTWDCSLPPQSRLTIPVHGLDATLTRPASPAPVEVLGDNPRGIVVEQASYDAKLQAGSCRLLTKIEE